MVTLARKRMPEQAKGETLHETRGAAAQDPGAGEPVRPGDGRRPVGEPQDLARDGEARSYDKNKRPLAICTKIAYLENIRIGKLVCLGESMAGRDGRV